MKIKLIFFLFSATFIMTACKSKAVINDDIIIDDSAITEENIGLADDMLSDDNASNDDTLLYNPADSPTDSPTITPTDSPTITPVDASKDNVKGNSPIKVTTPSVSYLDQLKAYQLELGGKSYQLPITLGDLTSNGWKLNDQEGLDYNTDKKLKPLQDTFANLTKGHSTLYITIINQTLHTSKEYNEFLICGIEGDITLPGGITINSSVDEVKAKYGEPANSSGAKGGWLTLRYVKSSHKYIKDKLVMKGVELQGEKGKLINIKMSHLNVNLLDMVAKIDKRYSYTTPTKVSKTILDYTFGLENKYYTIPAPLSAFLDQGFTVKGILSDELYNNEKTAMKSLREKGKVLAPSDTLPLILERNNKIIAIQIKNEYDSFQYYKDCTVINVRILPLNTGATYKVPGKIQLGSTEEVLLTSLEDLSYSRYTATQLNAYFNDYTYSNYGTWVRYVVYTLAETKQFNDNEIPYKGKISYDIVDGIITEINFSRLNSGNLGTVNKNDLISSTDTSENKFNYSNEEMFDFLNYSDGDYSSWSESNYVMGFNKSSTFTAFDAGAGNPWLLLYGDFVDGSATYTIDADNNLILVDDYERTIRIHYTILSSFEMKITIDDDKTAYYFIKR